MTNKPIKKAKIITPEMVDEQKRNQALQFLAQRREQFSITILSSMVHGAVTNKDVTNFQCKSLVDLAVEMADRLMEKLYPIKEETK